MSLNQNDYSKKGMFWFVLSMVVTFAVMIYVAFLSGGVNLKEIKEDAGAQQNLAQGGAAAPAKPVDISAVKDPWNPSKDMIAHGAQVFKTNCAMCHGNEGKGDGIAGASLNPKPRNFVEGKWKKGGTRLGLYEVLHDGLKGSSMQSYKASLKPPERWALIHFIRSITQNLVKDDQAEVDAKAPKLD
jgi:mono/diheme cytochrome c family protein